MTRQSQQPPDPERFGPGVTNAAPGGEGTSADTHHAAARAPSRPSPTPPRQPGEEAEGSAAGAPAQPFHHLDVLWLQVAGTFCNLACTHCFVTCGPHEDRHAMMSRAEVHTQLDAARALGVKEVYMTGGEPFLNTEIEDIVEDTLAHTPVTVLTNGTLFTRRRVAWLAALSARARFSLELRVSLDGTNAAAHDAFRGPGAWLRALAGLRALTAAGLLPIVTVTRPAHEEPRAFAARCTTVLLAEGVATPRLKLLPMFQLGREAVRSGPYPAAHTLAALPGSEFDAHRLQCGSCRAVTSRGVYVCPLLVDEPGGRMADTLAGSLHAFPLVHAACATCYATGMTCANG